MVNNLIFFKYVKVAFFAWFIVMCGFAIAYFTGFGHIGKAIMWAGILLGGWAQIKATKIFFRDRAKKPEDTN
jgi:hypothetical protein